MDWNWSYYFVLIFLFEISELLMPASTFSRCFWQDGMNEQKLISDVKITQNNFRIENIHGCLVNFKVGKK